MFQSLRMKHGFRQVGVGMSCGHLGGSFFFHVGFSTARLRRGTLEFTVLPCFNFTVWSCSIIEPHGMWFFILMADGIL